MLVRPSASESRATEPPAATRLEERGHPGPASRPAPDAGDPQRSTPGTAGTTPSPISKRTTLAAVAVLALGLALAAGVVVKADRNARTLNGRSGQPAQDVRATGLPLKAALERLDALALRLQLTGEPAYRESFLQELRVWSTRLADARADAGLDPNRREALLQTATALDGYAATAAEWVGRDRPSLRRDTAGLFAAEIDAASAPVRAACDALIAADLAAESAWKARAAAQSAGHTRQLLLLVGLLLGSFAVAAVLAWKGVVQPIEAACRDHRAALRNQDRLSKLGAVAAAVVHEIRSPLTAIRTRTHQLHRSAPEGGADLAVIEGEIRRLDRILEDFLQFARPAEPRRETMDAATLLRGIQDLVARSLADREIALTLEAPPGLTLDIDPAQLRQVLLNLVRNAADSLTAGGRITLRARAGMDTRPGRAAPVIMLEVADTGTGIAPEVEARLFEPFVSAKPQGTGLGLSIAARLVEAHGGHLQYQTETGRGTVFTVVLPRPPAAFRQGDS